MATVGGGFVFVILGSPERRVQRNVRISVPVPAHALRVRVCATTVGAVQTALFNSAATRGAAVSRQGSVGALKAGQDRSVNSLPPVGEGCPTGAFCHLAQGMDGVSLILQPQEGGWRNADVTKDGQGRNASIETFPVCLSVRMIMESAIVTRELVNANLAGLVPTVRLSKSAVRRTAVARASALPGSAHAALGGTGRAVRPQSRG
mmetsp:Transcript_28380/g.55555  ORF Transcript_28380/g.55555 Transcript_28380/m.55555 type:complete len:205 (+) Transcript_28380:216-830(+)